MKAEYAVSHPDQIAGKPLVPEQHFGRGRASAGQILVWRATNGGGWVPETPAPDTNIAAAAASTLTGQNQEGSSTSLARADHDHALPSWSTAYAAPPLTAPAGAAVVANRVYYHEIKVLTRATLTGLRYFIGVSSGNVRVALYDSGGARVANRSTNVAVGSALSLQSVTFDSTYVAAPGCYAAGIVFDNAVVTTFFAVPAYPSNYVAGPGGGATAVSITYPTAPAASVPLLATY